MAICTSASAALRVSPSPKQPGNVGTDAGQLMPSAPANGLLMQAVSIGRSVKCQVGDGDLLENLFDMFMFCSYMLATVRIRVSRL